MNGSARVLYKHLYYCIVGFILCKTHCVCWLCQRYYGRSHSIHPSTELCGNLWAKTPVSFLYNMGRHAAVRGRDSSGNFSRGLHAVFINIFHQRISMGINGYQRISMDIYRYPWMSMDIHRYPLISMDIHGFP